MRALLAALLAANLLFFGFSRGWFDGAFGLHALGDREPERLAAQVRPGSVRILPMGSVASASPAASAPTACYEAGPFAAADAASIEAQLNASLPAGSWVDVRADAAPAAAHLYRVAAATADLASRLTALKLGAAARGFSPCAAPTSPR